MNKEEKEQWLYEAYQYTSNFDFNRLDKYEEANDDICIDDLILDYTMLYEFHKEEIERLNKELETLKQPQVFIDTQDMEERYGEELYKEYLEKENKRLNNIINEALGIANERFNYYSNHKNNNQEHLEDWGNIFNILLRRDNK